MKLTDIDEKLDEAPVGFLKRAATKLQKHTPFAKGARARAEGRDVLEKAANELALAWQTYVGKADLNKNAITPDEILSFLEAEGYLKTGEEVVKAVVAKKKPKTAESLEARLANIIKEQDQLDLDLTPEQEREGAITLTNKEVEQILFKTLAQIHKENPKGLAQKVDDKTVRSQRELQKDTEQPGATETGKISDEEFQRVSAAINDVFDEFTASLKIQDPSMSKMLKDKFAQAKAKVAAERSIEALK